MHSIIYDKSKKALIAAISGNIGVEQANTMLSDFKKSIVGIAAKENILIINPENITASFLVLPILQSFIQLIAQLNFKRIYILNSDKYADIIRQSLKSYGVGDSIKHVASVQEALRER